MQFTDQLRHTIHLPQTPGRIVSLVPSQTELLFDLGLDEEVIGITKFCIHPNHWFRSKTRIGGTKNINIEKVKALRPHLIIANKEENVQSQVEELAKHFPVWTSDIQNLDDALEMIEQLGALTGKSEKANNIKQTINKSFQELSKEIKSLTRVAYLIWKDPYMTVGGDTFIHDLLQRAGFKNVFEDKNRYPTITIDDLVNSNCDLLLLSSEPYPFAQKHIEELTTQIPGIKILLVDGELFSWYGSRLQHSAAYFKSLHQTIAAIR